MHFSKDKDLIKHSGAIFRRQPTEYGETFDLESLMDDAERKQKLEELFTSFLVPFSTKALSRAGIQELAQNDEIYLLPAVKKELEKL